MKQLHWLIGFLVLASAVSFWMPRETFQANSSTNASCKDIIFKRLGIQNEQQFQDMFRVDVTQRIQSKRPVCNAPLYMAVLEIISMLKSDMQTTSGMETDTNKNVQNCILPLANIASLFSTESISLQQNGTTNMLDATIKFSPSESMRLATNIPNSVGTNVNVILASKGKLYNDKRDTWGLVFNIDKATLKDLLQKLATLYYFKNKPYFDILQKVADKCNEYEQKMEDFRETKTNLEDTKEKLSSNKKTVTQEYERKKNKLADVKHQLQEMKQGGRSIQERLETLKKSIEGLREKGSSIGGWRVMTFSGYIFTYPSLRLVLDAIVRTKYSDSYYVKNFFDVNGTNVYRQILGGKTNVSLMATTYFCPDKSGTWTFQLESNSGCIVWTGSAAIQKWKSGLINPTAAFAGKTSFNLNVMAQTLYPIRILQGSSDNPGYLRIYYKHSSDNSFSWSGMNNLDMPIFIRPNFT